MPSPTLPTFISGEINNAPHFTPAVVLTGGVLGENGPALQAIGGAVDVPALSIAGSAISAAAVQSLTAPSASPQVAAGAVPASAFGGSYPLITMTLAAGFILTLPAAASIPAGSGAIFASALAPTSGNGYEVDPIGTDVMRGLGFTPAATKGARNTQATAKIGDSITLVSDGVGAWYIVSAIGTWARTP
jgi:hypothetical protein